MVYFMGIAQVLIQLKIYVTGQYFLLSIMGDMDYVSLLRIYKYYSSKSSLPTSSLGV